MVFLTGRSGAGKSTVLKLIALLERPTRGRVLVGGADTGKLKARRVPAFRRRVGVVFQDHRLLVDRPVFDNVALPLDRGRQFAQGDRQARARGARPGGIARQRAHAAGGALGRRAAAGRHRARHHQPTADPDRRRADRQPRPAARERSHGAVPPPQRGRRDGGRRHARPAPGARVGAALDRARGRSHRRRRSRRHPARDRGPSDEQRGRQLLRAPHPRAGVFRRPPRARTRRDDLHGAGDGPGPRPAARPGRAGAQRARRDRRLQRRGQRLGVLQGRRRRGARGAAGARALAIAPASRASSSSPPSRRSSSSARSRASARRSTPCRTTRCRTCS